MAEIPFISSEEEDNDEQDDNHLNHHLEDDHPFLDGIENDENGAHPRRRKNRKKIEFKWGKRKKERLLKMNWNESERMSREK